MTSETATALDGRLAITGTVEGSLLHLVRCYNGQVQHKFLRADIHARTQDELRIAVRSDLDWLLGELLK